PQSRPLRTPDSWSTGVGPVVGSSQLEPGHDFEVPHDLTSRNELARRQVAERAVWPALIVIEPPRLDLRLGTAIDANWCTFKHSSSRRPLNASRNAFSTGFPGRIKSSCTPR